jgi:mono/diheme cytochrome c family protein
MKLAVFLIAILSAAVFAGAGNQPATTKPVPAGSPAVQAAALYAQYCAKCHGADGRGQTNQGKALGARDFNNPRWKARTSVDDAVITIRDGEDDMPAYNRRLSTAQIRSLAEYVKNFPH